MRFDVEDIKAIRYPSIVSNIKQRATIKIKEPIEAAYPQTAFADL